MKNEKSLSRQNRRTFLAAGAAIGGTLATTRANAQKASASAAKHKVVFELTEVRHDRG